MRLLILGGTAFLGRYVAQAAFAHGHTVSLFTRGKTNAELFPEMEHLTGDRTDLATGLDALKGRRWDAVIDTSGYVPRLVRGSAELLATAVDSYVFISTISVYAQTREPGLDETAPVGVLEDATTEEITGETYGPLKALCEQAVESAFAGRSLIVRPGLIVGPNDPTDRFTYWPHRVARGGEVLSPGDPETTTQFIDVRDLAEWILRQVEQGATGVYNATGPAAPLTIGAALETSRVVSGSSATFTWVDEAFLLEAGVAPWTELPLWIPSSDPDAAGFSAISTARAQAAGLTFRPLAETIRATLAWDAPRPAEYAWRAGLSHEREAELLALWHQSPQ